MLEVRRIAIIPAGVFVAANLEQDCCTGKGMGTGCTARTAEVEEVFSCRCLDQPAGAAPAMTGDTHVRRPCIGKGNFAVVTVDLYIYGGLAGGDVIESRELRRRAELKAVRIPTAVVVTGIAAGDFLGLVR